MSLPRSVLRVMIASALCFSALPASAEIKSVTDDAGREVAIPVQPQRVITLFDALLTLPLHELGLPIVGSMHRNILSSGERQILGFELFFGETPKDANIVDIGTLGNYDLEKMRALEPDLIVGSEYNIGDVDAMSAIAPVYIKSIAGNGVLGNQAQQEMSEAFGRSDRYKTLKHAYQSRLAELREAWPTDPEGQTFVAVLPSDQIGIFEGASAVVQVMTDLGYTLPQWILQKEERGFIFTISPEDITNLEADLVLMISGHWVTEDARTATKANMNAIAPGWDAFLPAAKEGRIVYLPGIEVMMTTFASAHAVLDHLEAQILN